MASPHSARYRFTLKELMVVLFLGVVVIVAAGAFLEPRIGCGENPARVNCAGNLKQIGLAAQMYSYGHDGWLPAGEAAPDSPNFEPLNRLGILVDGKVYSCYQATSKPSSASASSYRYRGQGYRDDHPDADTVAIAFDAPYNHTDDTWVNYLYIDGHVEGERPIPPGSRTAYLPPPLAAR